MDSYNAYLETLSELEGFISTQTFDNLIICDDFNVDFARANRHCNILSSSMHSLNLIRADINSDVTFTYRRDDFTVFSWPDHVISLKHHARLIKEVSCEDSVDNFSDHLPLSFSIALPSPSSPPSESISHRGSTRSNSAPLQSSCTVDWNKVSPENIAAFCDNLRDNIPNISHDLFACTDPTCKRLGKGHILSAPLIDGFISDKDISKNFTSKLREILNIDKSPDSRLDLRTSLLI